MSIEAHHCNTPNCKGFVVFENADFDFDDMKTDEKYGCYAFTRPKCSECRREFLVVPHYVVIDVKDKESGEFDILESACITEFEKRQRERKFNSETNPRVKVMLFIEERGYTYSVEDVVNGYLNSKDGYYVSYTMKDCITNLEEQIKLIME
jgi:hypothetical protein